MIWPEHLTNRSFLVGIDQTALANDYKLLTGGDLPVNPIPIPPAPVPTNAITAAQNSANLQMAVMAHAFIRYAHSGLAGEMANELAKWLAAWGL